MVQILKKESGLFSLDGSFRSKQQIRRDMALRGDLPSLQRLTPVAEPKDVDEYLAAAEKRGKQMRELSQRSENHVKVSLPRTSAIHIMGDLHIGHPDTDYRRIRQEVEAIRNTGDNYVILAGDIVDGINWGGESGGEQSLNLNEQRGTLKGLFRALRGKIIAGVSGEHDSKWMTKTGADPYEMMADEAGAPYVRGIAEIETNVGDQTYKVVAAHKMRGHSMYNKNHPTYRNSRFDLQGGDVYVSAHTHKKQVSQEAIREFGDRARRVTHVSIGPYKKSDAYGQRNGFVNQKEEEMFGASIRLHDDEHRVDVLPDILQAIRNWFT